MYVRSACQASSQRGDGGGCLNGFTKKFQKIGRKVWDFFLLREIEQAP